MAVKQNSFTTLAKITGVNLKEKLTTCVTAVGVSVSATFFNQGGVTLRIPSTGEIWTVEFRANEWRLLSRVDRESSLSREYDKLASNDIKGDVFLVADGELRIRDKFGSLFSDIDPGKINPDRIGVKITTTSVVTARVTSFGNNANATIEWPLDNPSHSGTGPAEQGISHIGAIVRAIVDSENNVLWVSLPGNLPGSGDSPFYIGSGGKEAERLRESLDSLNEDLDKTREDLGQLSTDLDANDQLIADVGSKVDQAMSDIDSLGERFSEVEETVTLNGGKNTYSIYYPETIDGIGKPINAMWQVMGEDGKTLKETYIWDGTAWLRYGYGVDSFSDDTRERMNKADADLAEAKSQLSALDSELEQAGLALGELEEGFADVSGKADQATLDAREAHNVAVEAQNKADLAVVDTQTEYAVGTSDTDAPLTGWGTEQPTRIPGRLIWIRTKVTYCSGETETSSPALLTGNDGTPAVVLRIDSSRGTAFKNNAVSTVLSVTIFVGDKQIANIDDLHDTLGIGAYLEWHWRRLEDESFGLISSADPRLGNAGFTLTVSPDDVDEQAVFQCVLNK